MPTVELTGRSARWYAWIDWPLRLACLTALWLAGVLAGLVVAGVAPATLAAHCLVRAWLDEPEVRPWRAFWSAWHSRFWRAQVDVGLPLATAWVIAFYLVALRQTVVAVALTVVLLGYLLTLWFLPAVAAYHPGSSAVSLWRLTVDVVWRQPVLPIAAGAVLSLLLVATWYAVPGALVLAPAVAWAMSVWVVRRLLSSRQQPRGTPDRTKSGPPAR